MIDEQDQPKRPRGRPPTRQMAEPIPDNPENVARAIMAGPPKVEWDYLEARSSQRETG